MIQSAPLFVTGIKRDWHACARELDRLGLPRYLALREYAYDTSLKR